MRGDDGICGSFFSYIDLDKRIRPDHPLRLIRDIANTALKTLSGEFGKLYSPIGRGSIPPERLMRAMLLQAFYSIPLGAPIGRADRHRSVVSLVCRARHRGCGVGRHNVQQEPRPAARWRAGGQVSRRRVVATSGQAAAVERSLLGRRDIVGGLGQRQELSAKRRLGRIARSAAQWRARLSWRAPPQRHACLDHRCRRPALPQGQGQGGAVWRSSVTR